MMDGFPCYEKSIEKSTDDELYFYLKYYNNTDDAIYDNIFLFRDNQEVEVIDINLFPVDKDGDTIRLTPLFMENLEAII